MDLRIVDPVGNPAFATLCSCCNIADHSHCCKLLSAIYDFLERHIDSINFHLFALLNVVPSRGSSVEAN